MRDEGRSARVFRNGRNQAVRIPRAMEFSGKTVFITQRGDEVILSVRPRDWSELLTSETVATPGFLGGGCR